MWHRKNGQSSPLFPRRTVKSSSSFTPLDVDSLLDKFCLETGRHSTDQFEEKFGNPDQFENTFGSPDQFENTFGNPDQFENTFGNPDQFENIFGNPDQFKNTFGNPDQFENTFGNLDQFKSYNNFADLFPNSQDPKFSHRLNYPNFGRFATISGDLHRTVKLGKLAGSNNKSTNRVDLPWKYENHSEKNCTRNSFHHSNCDAIFGKFVKENFTIDLSSLDDILKNGDSAMTENRTTHGWRSSFQSVRGRFDNPNMEENEENPVKQSKSSNHPLYSSRTLPRKLESTMKNAKEMSEKSLLSRAIERRRSLETTEMPEREKRLSHFWRKTIDRNLDDSSTVDKFDQVCKRMPKYDSKWSRRSPSPLSFSSDNKNSLNTADALKLLRFDELNDIVAESNSLDRISERKNGHFYSGKRYTKSTSFKTDIVSNGDSAGSKKGKTATNEHRTKPDFDALNTNLLEINGKNHVSKLPKSDAFTVHSLSPDSIIDDSGLPSLPHPKPKHHLREQLLSVGIEPRSPTFPQRISNNSQAGSVAARISEIERRPACKSPLSFGLKIAGISSPKMAILQPTVYKTKPVIRMNVSENGSNPTKSPQSADPLTFTFVQPKSPLSPRPSTIDTFDCPYESMLDEFSKLKLMTPPKGQKKSPLRPNEVVVTKQVVPRFYFPIGIPPSIHVLDNFLHAARLVFDNFNDRLSFNDLPRLLLAIDLPLYWKRPIFDSIVGRNSNGSINFCIFSQWWHRFNSNAHDEATRFVYILSRSNRSYLEKADFEPLIDDLIQTFPGLSFLKEVKEFHSRYIQTVIVRVFYTINRSWTGRITARELRRGNFLQTVRLLEQTDDINSLTNYFSYEHFYVIYCEFWELDKDHNLIIDKNDMANHANGAIPSGVIERIFNGTVSVKDGPSDTMSYTDFVTFLLAEEDKSHPTSIEYWFRVLDLDGDGFLSLFELNLFYEEVVNKMAAIGVEIMKFDDVACQFLDMINPKIADKIQLSDLKRCALAGKFLNIFVNIHKYYDQETTDGERVVVKTDSNEEMSDWDRFCAEQYELLMREENPDEFELDCDNSDDEMSNSLKNSENALTRSSLMDTL